MANQVKEDFVAHLQQTLGLPTKVGNLFFNVIPQLHNEKAWNEFIKKVPKRYHLTVTTLKYAMSIMANAHTACAKPLYNNEDGNVSMADTTLDYFKKLHIFKEMSDSTAAVNLLCTSNTLIHLSSEHGVPLGMALKWIKEYNEWHQIDEDIQLDILVACKDLSDTYPILNLLQEQEEYSTVH